MVRNQTGFTLTELVLTILLISILAATALPRFFSNKVFEQDLFEKQLAVTLSYAQNLAVGSGCHIAVTNNATSITLNLRNGCTTGSFTNIVHDPNNVNLPLIKTAPNHITLTSNNFPIYFNEAGQARQTINDRIANSNLFITGAEKTTTITIKGSTGRIIIG